MSSRKKKQFVATGSLIKKQFVLSVIAVVAGAAANYVYEINAENKRLKQVIKAHRRESASQGKVPVHQNEEVQNLAATNKKILETSGKV